jgi:hypothetical protein
VPVYKTALRVGLWIAAFALAVFSSLGIGLTLGGKIVGGTGVTVIAVILYGLIGFGLLGGLLIWIRKEAASQRGLLDSAAEQGDIPRKLPTGLTATGMRILSMTLAGVSVIIVLLAWLA